MKRDDYWLMAIRGEIIRRRIIPNCRAFGDLIGVEKHYASTIAVGTVEPSLDVLATLYTRLHDFKHHDLADRVLEGIRETARAEVRQ
jgi:hypothetical protein